MDLVKFSSSKAWHIWFKSRGGGGGVGVWASYFNVDDFLTSYSHFLPSHYFDIDSFPFTD